MKFNEVLIYREKYNKIILNWNYFEDTKDVSLSNYFIRISISGIKEGPFSVVDIVSALNLFYEYSLYFKKWEYYYFKLEIIKGKDVLDSRVVELNEYIDAYVKFIRKKYSTYLSKRVQNPIKIFKKKKVGEFCKYCLDKDRNVFIHSFCPICFGVGYGDDVVFGLKDLEIDGWLKKNRDGELEFYKKNWYFEKYPAINSNVDFGIYPGDEFRIENLFSPVLSININYAKGNSIFLDNNSNFIKYLDSNNFSVYGLEKKVEFNVDVRILYDPFWKNYRLYIKGVSFEKLDFNIISFQKDENTSIKGFVNEKYEDYVSFNFVNLDDAFSGCEYILFLDGNEVVFSYKVENIFFNIEEVIGDEIVFLPKLFLKSNYLNIDDRLYVEYFYDGNIFVKKEGKNIQIAKEKNSKISLAYFSVIDKNDFVYTLKSETFSEYIITDDVYIKNYIILFFGKKFFDWKVYQKKDRYVMHKELVYIKPNSILKINDVEIKKDGFAGCGILLIDIKNGKTYQGPTWDGKKYLDDGDFYVNLDMKEINTLNLPEGHYELTYIYKLKNLKLDSYFIPLDVYNVYDFKYNNRWVFKHPSLKNKENLVGKKLIIYEKEIYEEFDIKEYNDTVGLIICENNKIDSEDFFEVLTKKVKFSIIYPKSGGYYNSISSWINYVNMLQKYSVLGEIGLENNVRFNAIIPFYPKLESGDIIYDEKTQLFYKVISVDIPYFRRAELFQRLYVEEIPGLEQEKLYLLLDR